MLLMRHVLRRVKQPSGYARNGNRLFCRRRRVSFASCILVIEAQGGICRTQIPFVRQGEIQSIIWIYFVFPLASGCSTVVLRLFMFNGTRPKWFYGFGLSLVSGNFWRNNLTQTTKKGGNQTLDICPPSGSILPAYPDFPAGSGVRLIALPPPPTLSTPQRRLRSPEPRLETR